MTIELVDALSSVLSDVVKNKELQRDIDNRLYEGYNFPRSTFIEILVNNEILDSLPEEEIIVIMNTVYEVTNDDRMNPQHHFKPRDIKKALSYFREDELQAAYPYTLQNVISAPTGRDYVTIMSFKELRALWESKIITYNFSTQRLSKKKVRKDGEIVEKPDVNLKSVKNISRLMVEGKYKADTILLNILVDGHDDIQYNDGKLTIQEGTTVNLIDGMHRVQAILNVLEEDPQYEGFINVSIKHYPLQEAQFLLGQINTVNRFDKTLVKHYMAESIGSQVTKELMNIPELRKRVSIKTTLDKKMNYLTNFSILSESIESIFQPQNNKDRYDITEVLTKFFGYLIPAFEEEFLTHTKEVAKTSWVNHHNTFVGYIVIAKKLFDKYGKDYPVDEIVRIVNGINLSKVDSDYNDLMTTQGKVNSNKIKRQIREFFEHCVDKLLA
ncbi:DNA sulfur modification protein DndB [Paenibacillus sp. ACRRX]|uniref:DNA sulfur modification protein DndB n=1 Tax=unclassified Paenibacillus TaxID=185978 RepID=UPI001EF42952|nr:MULTISPECIES: DNA sulfur modification protein DndB [unclassified Paenibacillus]MCG7406391.1 DNA sulfur modification protein DndB [Paenibacillus sp. ACRRX]MDK8179422.1 DNA sulfur modification protein DndB [Paenibacillus sp. UMB4589-SE434]